MLALSLSTIALGTDLPPPLSLGPKSGPVFYCMRLGNAEPEDRTAFLPCLFCSLSCLGDICQNTFSLCPVAVEADL